MKHTSVVCLKMKMEFKLHLLIAETEFLDKDGRIISLEVPVIHKTNVNLNRESVSSFGSGKKTKMRETLPPFGILVVLKKLPGRGSLTQRP